MRTIMQKSLGLIAAAIIGSTTLAGLSTSASSQTLKLAQADGGMSRGEGGASRGEGGMSRGGGERGGAERGGGRGGDRGDRGGAAMERGMSGGERGGADRGGGRGGDRGGVERGDRMDRGGRIERGGRGEVQRFERRETRRDFRRDDRYERRGDRWDRRDRVRSGFVYLGGPRIVVRGYGPGWCRGLHRGYHWAPRIGWHDGRHVGLYRCR